MAVLILGAFCGIGFLPAKALAQEDDFFIEEPTDFEEPEEFETPPVPNDDPDFSGAPPGFVPPPIRGGGGAVRNSGRFNGAGNAGGDSSIRPNFKRNSGTPGAVEFTLVDPPRYWKKRPRPPMPKPKAY